MFEYPPNVPKSVSTNLFLVIVGSNGSYGYFDVSPLNAPVLHLPYSPHSETDWFLPLLFLL